MLKNQTYDVVIIGAGPSGATLARLLDSKYSILLIDARNLTTDFENIKQSQDIQAKCCGGLLAPDAQTWLNKFNLIVPEKVKDIYQPEFVNTIDLSTHSVHSYKKNYINLDRTLFETWLLSLLPENVQCLFNSRLHGLKHFNTNDHFTQLSIKTPAGIQEIKTRIVVGADGAFSAVRRMLGKGISQKDCYLAIQDKYKVLGYSDKNLTKTHWAAFDESLTDFYGWAIPKKDSYLVGLALPLDASKNILATKLLEQKDVKNNDKTSNSLAHRKLNIFTQRLIEQGLTLSSIEYDKVEREGALVVRPSLNQVYLGRDNCFLIGEAAGFISPSSAEGFSYAFASAFYLAEVFNKTFDPIKAEQSYRRKIFSLKANIAWKNLKGIGMYNQTLRNMALKVGLGF
ncbi:lycopene cyclase family protein [Desulfovibrio litoralis]|uniref:Dehydrogenase (Flavoprotein) n=1 Tax=Desulfovibrio litoralis DSM 11393 TaxID=1121455 RepID=A0A1M7SAJ4_9BACT|nr:lycopene cyclase family protein [Desulfovibrio litoralis]SHN55496.1 Dehydrogenase (flavoprotein) [Desulfovibrio litoralis DSM 11393]